MSDKSYDLESGIGFTSTVEDVFYETNDEWFDPDIPRLVLEFANERRIQLKTGAGWEANKKGDTVTHPTKSSFTRNSQLGRFLGSFIKLDGARDLLEKRGHATEAKIWKGLTLTVDEVEDSFKDRETGEDVQFSYRVVTAFEADGKAASAKADGWDDAIKAKLDEQWAASEGNHATFMEKAYANVPEIATEPDLMKLVEDASNWT